MTKTFTQNDIIRFVYEETQTTSEIESVHNAIWKDSDMQDFYYEVSEIRNSLGQLKLEPSERVTQNILNYSRAFSLHQ
jgi:hypothetical protein